MALRIYLETVLRATNFCIPFRIFEGWSKLSTKSLPRFLGPTYTSPGFMTLKTPWFNLGIVSWGFLNDLITPEIHVPQLGGLVIYSCGAFLKQLLVRITISFGPVNLLWEAWSTSWQVIPTNVFVSCFQNCLIILVSGVTTSWILVRILGFVGLPRDSISFVEAWIEYSSLGVWICFVSESRISNSKSWGFTVANRSSSKGPSDQVEVSDECFDFESHQ